MAAGIAAAVGVPAADAVDAAPGGVFENLGVVLGWMLLQKLAVVGDLRQAAALDVIERVGQRHVAERVVMPVGFAVGGDVGQLRAFALIRQSIQKPARKTAAIVQQAFEGHGLRHGPVVEEQMDGAAGRQLLAIGTRRIDALAA